MVVYGSMLAWLLFACTPPEDLVKTKLDEEGFALEAIEAGRKANQFKFQARRGSDKCKGTADVDGPQVTLDYRCTRPAGPIESALPNGVPDGVRSAARGCDDGQQGHCYQLGVHYLDGAAGLEPDVEKGAALVDKACNTNHSQACLELANRTMTGHVLEEDDARSAQLFEKACRAGEIAGCVTGGRALLTGEGLARDEKLGLALLTFACLDHDHGDTCELLGRVYDEGKRTRQDEPKAYQAWKHGCDHDHATCCGMAGVYTYMGRGTKRDQAAGKALIQKGCDAGDDYSCRRLKEVN